MKYRVHIGGKRYRRFAALIDATAFCNEFFNRKRIVLAIEAI